jgi:hypothetical protein
MPWPNVKDPLEVYLPSNSAEGVRRRIKKMEQDYLQAPLGPPPPAPPTRTPRRPGPGDEGDEHQRRDDGGELDELDELDRDDVDDGDDEDQDDDEDVDEEPRRVRRGGRRARIENLLHLMALDYRAHYGVSYERAYQHVLESKIGRKLYQRYVTLMPMGADL